MNNQNVSYHVWNDQDCKKVVDATLQVLEKTGCIIQNKTARNLLEKAGCKVSNEKVFIPSEIVMDAIKTTPSEITLYDRNGEESMKLTPGQVNFGPPITTVYIKDPFTGEKRRATREDAKNAALVCEAMPRIAWASAMAGISDGIPEMTDLYEVQALLSNTRKPIMYWATDINHLEKEFEMFEAVARDANTLRKKPFTIGLICPMDPLTHTDDGLEQLMYLAKKRSPVIYIAGVNFGSSAPVSLAGNVIVGLADTLVGLVISQLTEKGTPFIASKFTDNLDMSTVTITHSMPEADLANSASADIFRFLNIPFSLNYGDTDCGMIDQVATFDISTQIYTAHLSKTNMAMSIGGFESGNMSILSALVLGNDIIGHTERLCKKVDIDEESLALESIHKVGPGGNFLMEEMTFRKCREFWKPEIFTPRSHEKWITSNKENMEDILNNKVKEIIAAGCKCPLPQDIQNKIDAIIRKEENSY